MTTPLHPMSDTLLRQRRQRLRQQRRLRTLHSVWQTLVVYGLAIGLYVGVHSSPIGLIEEPEQVTIRGNKALSTNGLKSLLPLTYPVSLLTLRPQTLAQQLADQPTIAQARVERQLFPSPRLTIQIQERQPVAIAQSNRNGNSSLNHQSQGETGLLDAQGVWIPLDLYKKLAPSFKPPALGVKNWQHSYHRHWPDLYRAIHQSAVTIQEVDWGEPTNLILKTDLGIVHCGPFAKTKFPQQLAALDQMRDLTVLKSHQVVYIELHDVTQPTLMMKTGTQAAKPNPTSD